MLELTVNLILKAISTMPVEINPTTLEWLKHYVFGKQKPKILPEKLKTITLVHVIKSLCSYAAFSPSTLWGHASWFPYRGDISWYTHPTLGVVGGFIYKLISYEDKFIIKCQDDWDFNVKMNYHIQLPNGLDWGVIRPILRKIGCKFQPLYDEGGEIFSFGIDEEWLSKFNDNHKFTTTWELEIPSGICMPINHPLKEEWAREQKLKNSPRYKKWNKPIFREW
jgi:hypothetical protein